ncbi:MAG: haloalkane dehalogenase [Saprospiraceae bacterium]|nr:haloalkane dehalogenase [Saprospiraceae bacterium]
MKKILVLLALHYAVLTHALSNTDSIHHSIHQNMVMPSTDTNIISAKFPYHSKFLQVKGSNIHYIDEGNKDAKHTFVLLHGNPTSNYIWRNIVPYLTPHGRVIAPDLIGMGKSDKPDISYTFQEHINYIDVFLDDLALDNIILVIQDWGSGIGFHYAHRFPERVAGIVFLEGIVRTIEWRDANLIERYIFKRLRHPKKGHKMIVKKNFFVERFLPMMTKRKLSEEERNYYAAPYLAEADRKAVWIWPSQIAISGEPKASHDIILAYEKWLPTSELPKLMFHAKPGMIIKPKEAKKIKATWQNLESIDLGKGKHYLQETYPHQIGQGISTWFKETF